jgi:uncharacterized protein YijF (DUF1287 family)
MLLLSRGRPTCALRSRRQSSCSWIGQRRTAPTRPLDLVAAARAQVGVTLFYDPSYQQIAYPMGDVPPVRGVCSDVVIRAFRAVGIDPAGRSCIAT